MPAYPRVDFLLLQLRLKQIHQSKRLGQHFLTDDALLGRIADAAGAAPDTLAVEIGPGPGVLTTHLAARAGGVLAIELDRRLEQLHAESFGIYPEIRFHYADALRVNLSELAERRRAELGLARIVLAGNLPFQITSPFLFAQCGPGVPWRRMALMVQKEVAQRVVSPPDRKDYGILTVKLATWWRVVERFAVPAGRFQPPPRVDAAVLVFEPQPPPVDAAEAAAWWPGFSEFVDAAFAQRRKMLVNSLAARWQLFPGRERANAALARLGLDPRIRAEALSPGELARLHGHLARA
ncbi:MAG TPA: 16S rRNA (adenine(1518)-N(6)/adenine(1519)-N(6))-dimethyltransferase RsmA [Candidatus Sumerlaeota bacterium]|nr:MAG: Ribosomal RNA small subunit methyltransferase A [candidate division BRC1 bacterium ADurb.BinA292]HPK01711.1 16S rRNA (adenine(1518)-N(6)/adenine(1519)-N(6))-dimethyltransferase RsmA [Candidatus Sumerlaeota bacterium]